MNRTKRSIYYFFWDVTHRIIHIVFPVILRAFTIREIGAGYVRLNGLSKSVLHVLNLSKLGFGSTVVNMM